MRSWFAVAAECLVITMHVWILGFSTNVPPRDVLDLIKPLNATEDKGFQFTSGPNNNTLALVLEDPNRHIALPETVLQEALRILREHDEITFLASVKQEVGDSGSIISFSSDLRRFLEIESSGRKDEIRLHYTHDQQIHVETFPYRLSDGQWHLLALSLSGTQLTLLVDCSKIYQRVIQSVDRVFSSGKLTLFLGQRNGQHAFFKGALQDVRMVTQSHGYLLQCPEQNADCPTCAQYQALEQKIKDMYDLYQNISKKLLQAEERISGLEECECLRSCSDNGTVRKEGEEWQRDKCTVCRCMNGSIECQSVECPPVDCERPVYRDGECCPVCLTNCYYSGKYYDHGEQFSPRVCVECTCSNGKMVCKRQDQTCPELNCPESERIQIQGECCPVCKGTDFCALGHDCHVNATCINLATKYVCQCDPGFDGDGTFCEDVNECVEAGGKQGHHCHRNTVCVNTLGSYKCVCQSGHSRLDDYTCEGDSEADAAELDECESGSHQCHANADCLNVPGSYLCQCQPGYSGDGRHCEPICQGHCLNGGRCIAHNVCECRHGYIGPNCELDIDECALGISACRGHSVCVNTPGSYHCDCLQGFHSSWPQNHFGSLCLDLNECLGEGEGHSCHPSARCLNTEGGYQCQCPEHSPGCSRSCVFEGSDHANGSAWYSAMDKCMHCTCKDGVTSCHKRDCDCAADDVDLDCCAHCDVSSQCPHQELPEVMANGQHWVFQCQTCECLKGEIDCWPMECPPLSCAEQVQEPGQCCPRCVEENPCQGPGLRLGGADHSALTCLYLGHTFRDGDAWVLEADPCTSCECMAGHICCSFNQTCSTQNWR